MVGRHLLRWHQWPDTDRAIQRSVRNANANSGSTTIYAHTYANCNSNAYADGMSMFADAYKHTSTYGDTNAYAQSEAYT